jgi:dipeptidase
MRPLYLYKGDYPGTITSRRGHTWHPDNLEGTPEQLAAWGKESAITGYIPQVPHTYALYEAGYGIMNEHQVSIGESTCASRLWAAPTIAGGKAMIEAREMSMVGLERGKTAREVVQIMGDIAVKHGFYAADWSGGDMSLGEGGEGLTVIDKTEAWVFHVTSDDTGTSAVWVAQRVPDNHISVIANQFIIRTIIPDSPDFLYSANIFSVAERKGFWKPASGPLDFLVAYAPPRAHSPYATRRVWRVFNIANPSIVLPGDTDPKALNYPFSIPVDHPLSALEVMNMNRDHYEGTPYDLTKGLAAGPYGDPNRYDMAPVGNLTYTDVLQGSYERSISLFRTSYSFVAQARPRVPDSLARLWFSQYAPATSSYAPFYVHADHVPKQYSRGSLFSYDSSVSFWNFLAAGNYASRWYSYAIRDIQDLQGRLHETSLSLTNRVEAEVLAGTQGEGLVKLLTAASDQMATTIVDGWRDLLPQLITKYHDGYEAQDLTAPHITMKRLFYPLWWLQMTGYFDSHINSGPDTIMFAPSPAPNNGMGVVVMTALLSVLATLGVVYMVQRKGVQVGGVRGDYSVIGEENL